MADDGIVKSGSIVCAKYRKKVSESFCSKDCQFRTGPSCTQFVISSSSAQTMGFATRIEVRDSMGKGEDGVSVIDEESQAIVEKLQEDQRQRRLSRTTKLTFKGRR